MHTAFYLSVVFIHILRVVYKVPFKSISISAPTHYFSLHGLLQEHISHFTSRMPVICRRLHEGYNKQWLTTDDI